MSQKPPARLSETIATALRAKFGSYVATLKARPTDKPPLTQGLYALFEQRRPLYVGITKNLRSRWALHRWGNKMSASFAARLAREKIAGRNSDPGFPAALLKAKQRVKQMEFRWVELRPEHNDADLTVLEVFAAGELKTPYNNFATH